MEWLRRAQDVTSCGGVSGGYSFDNGWSGPYPETTGYIIPTFLRYADETGDESYRDRAIRMGDWEAEIQLKTGAVSGGVGVNDYPIVFNTGQVMIGWNALYRETGESKYLECSYRAGNWLADIQDKDGKWSRHTYRDLPHAYHTRVAWPMLEIAELSAADRLRDSAVGHINWVTNHVSKNGWIDRMAFSEGEMPLTHTISYTIRGLLESMKYLSGEHREHVEKIVIKASEMLMKRYELRKSDPYSMPKYMPARLNDRFRPEADYSCLTGNCQIALIWMKIHEMTDDARYLNSALKILDQVKATQSLDSSNPGVRGGIAGSYPIWGEYAPYEYPNWAAKFFADAILLQESIVRQIETVNV